MSKDDLKTKLAGPFIPQRTEQGNAYQLEDSEVPVLSSRGTATSSKKHRCWPSAQGRPSQSKGKRLKRWFADSALPTCLRRRRNGEGRVAGSIVAERRETAIPILNRRQPSREGAVVTKHVKLESNEKEYTKHSSVTTNASAGNEPKHASIKMTRAVMPPPPEKRSTRAAMLRHKTAKPVVIPRGQISENNLGSKQSIFSSRHRKKGAQLPKPGEDTDMYKEVIPNNLADNPVWSKPP